MRALGFFVLLEPAATKKSHDIAIIMEKFLN